MRVLPLENEAVNECWIADRDRFSYEALNTEQRLTQPAIKQNGQWQSTDWQTALDWVAKRLHEVRQQHGAAAIGTLASPHATVEELYLAAQLTRGIGSENIDVRLRAADFQHDGKHAGWAAPLPLCQICNRCCWWGPICAKTNPCWLNASGKRRDKAHRSCV